MISLAVVLGLLIALFFGTSDFLSKGLTAQVGFYRTTVYTLAVSGAFVFVPILFLGSPGVPSSLSGVALLAVIAISTFVAFMLMYRGYQIGHLSIVSPTVNSFPIFSVLISVFLLRVDVSPHLLLALAGVIIGIVLVSINLSGSKATRGRGLTPGVPEAILAALFFAIGLTALGYAEVTIGFLLPAMAARIGAATVGAFAGFALKQDLSPFGGRAFLRLLAMAGLEAGGILSLSLALFYSSSIVVLPITITLGGVGAAFTVGFALIFLKERVELNYAVGVVVLIASVVAVLYFTA